MPHLADYCTGDPPLSSVDPSRPAGFANLTELIRQIDEELAREEALQQGELAAGSSSENSLSPDIAYRQRPLETAPEINRFDDTRPCTTAEVAGHKSDYYWQVGSIALAVLLILACPLALVVSFAIGRWIWRGFQSNN
jgi:hypothetical protein